MSDSDRQAALEAIGTRIRQRRRERNLTQEEVAQRTGLSKSFVSEVESGASAANGLAYLRIARVLDVDVRWVLTGEAPQVEPAPGAVEVPPLVARIGEERGWSLTFTMDVAAAMNAVLYRRRRGGSPWSPTEDDVIRISEGLHGGKSQ